MVCSREKGSGKLIRSGKGQEKFFCTNKLTWMFLDWR